MDNGLLGLLEPRFIGVLTPAKQPDEAAASTQEVKGHGHAPWLHREVQCRVAGPVVQLRFISLFPGRVRVSSSELAHHGATDFA